MKPQRPVNQKSIYHSAGDVYEKIMNDEIPCENKLENALRALTIMNKAYGMELKRFQLENEFISLAAKVELRIVEAKNFDNIKPETEPSEV